jgi:hypothetical protein
MDRSGMKTFCGKPTPRTIDAIRFGKKYLDPNDLRLKCLDVASVGLAITGIIALFICIL